MGRPIMACAWVPLALLMIVQPSLGQSWQAAPCPPATNYGPCGPSSRILAPGTISPQPSGSAPIVSGPDATMTMPTEPTPTLAEQTATPAPDTSFDFAGPDLASSDNSILAPNMFGDMYGNAGGTSITYINQRSVALDTVTIADSTYNTGGTMVPSGRLGAVVPIVGPEPFFLLSAPEGTSLPIGAVRALQTGDANFVDLDPQVTDTNIVFDSAFVTEGNGLDFVVVDGYVIVSSSGGGGGQLAFAQLFATIADEVLVNVVSPTGGGFVGRTKIAEDNSPLPRDRLIFNLDHFANVPLSGDIDVTRASVGFERTFANRLASFEVRLPFASTLDNSFVIGQGPTDCELGNARLTLKGLLVGNETYQVATGFGLGLPTADDTHVLAADGDEFVRVRNGAVTISPYIAGLLTPNDRLFMQGWFGIDFDMNGNPLSVDVDGTGVRRFGRLQDQELAQVDGQIGYWVYQNGVGLVRAVAPFAELHYNTTLGDADKIAAGPFTISAASANIDEVTTTLGVNTLLGDRTMAALGLVLPLKDAPNRTFDYQLGFRLNWFFGPTQIAREQALYPASL